MNAERLLAHYEQIVDTPDAITRLRRFILDLAVRGKLEPQSPKDEPAAALLERIANEKARQDAGRATRGRSAIGRERTEEFAFTLPAGWVLSTLGDVALKITDGTHQTPVYVRSGVPFVSVKDFSAGQLSLSNTRFITPEEHRSLYQRCDPKRGDILIGRIGTLGRAVLVDTDIEFSLFVSVGLIRFSHENISPDFFRILLNSPLVEGEFNRIKIGGGTHTNKLNLGDLQTVALPLPPLGEQRRIVAKVDELMALCDRLDAARAERETTRDRLAASSLTRLNAPDSETFQDGARFVLKALPAITKRPDQIKQLRQTILSLAVRGKLVPQDARDEPASELLKRIAKEKERLVKEGEIREAKVPKVADPSALSFNTSPGWQAATIEQILIEVQTGPFGSSLHQTDYQVGGVPVINPASIQNEKIVPIEKMAVGIATLDRLSGFKLREGDIVMGRRGEMGRCAVVTDREAGWLCGTGSLILRLPKAVFARFFVLLIGSPYVRDYLGGSAVGATMQNLNQGILLNLVVGLPPLAEQRRIVARVDELIAICDQLESSLTDTAATRRQLLDALLAEALEPAEITKVEAVA